MSPGQVHILERVEQCTLSIIGIGGLVQYTRHSLTAMGDDFASYCKSDCHWHWWFLHSGSRNWDCEAHRHQRIFLATWECTFHTFVHCLTHFDWLHHWIPSMHCYVWHLYGYSQKSLWFPLCYWYPPSHSKTLSPWLYSPIHWTCVPHASILGIDD